MRKQRFFERYRLLDGYIGILGFIVWYKLLAWYAHFFYIWDLTIKYLFSTQLVYHPATLGKRDYPMFTFRISLFKWEFYTGKKAAEKIHARVSEYMKESKKREQDEADAKKVLWERIKQLEAQIAQGVNNDNT